MAQVLRGMFRTASHTGRPLVIGSNDDPRDPTLTAWVTGLRTAVEHHQVRFCPHLTGVNIQPMFLNAWDQPFELRCYDCQSIQPAPVGDDDIRCDTCGVLDPTGLWPMQMAIGAIVVSMGRCDDCAPEHRRGPHG